MTPNPKLVAAADKAMRELLDEDLLVAAGFASYRIINLPKDASDFEVTAVREAFYSGLFYLLRVLRTAENPREFMTFMTTCDDEIDRYFNRKGAN